MDWSRTKTIFIITFLCLNIFLGYQLAEKRSAGNINILAQPTFHMDTNNIEITIPNIEDNLTRSSISGTIPILSETNLKEELDGQEIQLLGDQIIHSVLEEPYSLVAGDMSAGVNDFLQQYVMNGEEYKIAEFNEEEGYIGLHQTHEGKAVHNFDERYHIRLELNDSLEIVEYTQTYMDISKEGREQELLSPLKVIEILYDNNRIPENAVIDEAVLEYYSLIETSADFEFFIPMWRIRINDTYHIVNATNGEVRPID